MELWDLYDEEGNPLGRTYERGKILKAGEYKLEVQIWVVKKNGKILVTRCLTNEEGIDFWETPGGAVLAGEKSPEGAVRKLKERIGVEVSSDELVYLSRQKEADALIDTYLLVKDIFVKELVLQADEVAEAKLVYESEIELMKQCGMLSEGTWNRFVKYRQCLLAHTYLVIEPAKLIDASEIMKAKEDAFRLEIEMYNREPYLSQSLEEERQLIERRGATNYAYVMRELETGRIVGGINGRKLRGQEFYVKCSFMAEKYQNKEIGSLLIHYLEKQFPNVTCWRIVVPYKSWRQQHFFEKFGYVKIGEDRPGIDGFHFYHYMKEMNANFWKSVNEVIPKEGKEENKEDRAIQQPIAEGNKNEREVSEYMETELIRKKEELFEKANMESASAEEQEAALPKKQNKSNMHFFELKKNLWYEVDLD